MYNQIQLLMMAHEKLRFLLLLQDMEIYHMMKSDHYQIHMILEKALALFIIMMEGRPILTVFCFGVAIGTVVVMPVPLRCPCLDLRVLRITLLGLGAPGNSVEI
jgi:hypothetical protein